MTTNETSESTLKITMGSLRLTGEQSARLLEIHRNKAVACYEHYDWKLRDLGLVLIGSIPPALKAAKEKWIAATWIKTRAMAVCYGAEIPSPAKIKEIEGLLNQMSHASYQLGRKWSTLTPAGAKLAADGRVVILPRDTPATREE